jgi:hypothetical protein
MMGVPENEYNLKCESEIKPWCESRGLPYSIYTNLSDYLKDLLRGSICKPTKKISSQQRRELYNGICSSVEFRPSNYQSSYSVTDDYLRDFFSPLSEHDKMPKDEWGGV